MPTPIRPARAALASPDDTLKQPSPSQTQPALQSPSAMKPLPPEDFPPLIISLPEYTDVWPQTSYLLQEDSLRLGFGEPQELLPPALLFLSISSGCRTPIWPSDQWYNTRGSCRHLDFCSSSLSSRCKFHSNRGHERWAKSSGAPQHPLNFVTMKWLKYFFKVPKWKWKLLSRVRLFATPWTTQSTEFSRPEYWSG